MDLQNIVDTWAELALEGRIERADIFFRFVAIWVAFNALYTSRHSDEVGDWDQVRSFAGEVRAIDKHRQLLDSDAEYQNAVDILKEHGVYDVHRHVRRRIRDNRDLTSVASCLYQIRCNLFHGGKMPDNPRDERLVSAGYTIVSRLIKGYPVGRYPD